MPKDCATSPRALKAIILVLSLVCVALVIAVIIVASKKEHGEHTHITNDDSDADAQYDVCKDVEEDDTSSGSPSTPSVFQDLTEEEITGLKHYLYEVSDLGLVKPSASKTDASYVFLAELHLPNKSLVLDHLDNNGPQPDREARVVIIRGKQPNLEVNEVVVGPLPVPTYHVPMPGINASLPYFYRPMTEEDYGRVTVAVTDQVHDAFGDIIEHCFGAKVKGCTGTCLEFLYASSFSPSSSGVNERKTWYWLTYNVEYYTLQPVDFSVLANIKPENISIDIVWFLGKQYESLAEAAEAYNNNSVTCEPQTAPTYDKTLFSTCNKRGTAPDNSGDKRPPIFVEPDGKRYKVTGKQVQYMKWSFDFRMSTAYGPQLYDIRFDNQRIVYELALQEISVFYSGHSPQQRFSDYMDSAELIGPSAQGLIKGVDCPSHATYFDTMHVTETSETPDTTKNVFCLFELNTGEPLRRHHSYFESEGMFYEGLENVVLVLRTVATIVNYDYIFDYRFYQNGFMEVKAMSTGYVLGNAFTQMEKKYGYQVHDRITANFHTHFFNYKVDLDVNGVNNRYEVVNIVQETEPNEFAKDKTSTYSQGKLVTEQRQTETEAAYKFNFDTPKYHLFYNNDVKDKYGNNRAYRLIHKGMVKQVLPEGKNKEPAINWARYQFAVTKHKDHEAHSSSMYSMFDSFDQVINFQSYIDDNESILDEDLVLWLTLGVHHIPHKEDLPLTTTPGLGLSFYLQPFNYFHEDPSMASPNAVRIEPGTNDDIHVQRYGTPTKSEPQCIPPKSHYEEDIQTDKSMIFEQ